MKDHQDVANSLLSDIERDNHLDVSSHGEVPIQASGMEVEGEIQRRSLAAACNTLDQSIESEKGVSIPNLSEVCHLDSLKWSSSRKRRRARELGKGSLRSKRQCGSGSSSSNRQEEAEAASNACSKFLLHKSSNVVDTDNCKIGGSDPLLVSPMALCSNLVMSQ